MNINEIIGKYTGGEATLEDTNAALKAAGANLHLDPERNSITAEEVGRFGLLDTGTGTLDKVEVAEGKLLDCDCGEMIAWCILGGKAYRVQGDALVEG